MGTNPGRRACHPGLCGGALPWSEECCWGPTDMEDGQGGVGGGRVASGGLRVSLGLRGV